MILQSGKHEGKSTQELVLKLPDWVQFFISKNPSSSVTAAMKSHISVFDGKAFIEPCFKCNDVATRASLYRWNARGAMYWCDQCDPYSLAASPGTLTMVKSYRDILRYIDTNCKASRSDKRFLVKDIAQKKGLPSRVTQQIAIDFF